MRLANRKTSEEDKLIFGFLQLPPALKSLNFCCYVIGASASFFGTWMTQIALVWLVYQLTNSPLLVGISGFTNQASSLVLTPLAGVLLDRWNLRRVLLTTQIISILLSLTLTFLTVSSKITVEAIIVIGILQGTVKAFDLPARQVLIPRIVERKGDTYSAIAFHSLMINTAKFVSPMVAGLVIARSGSGSCFLIDSVSYLSLIFALIVIKINPVPHKSSTQKAQILKNLKEGFIYAYEFIPIKTVLILLSLVCFMAMTHVNLMPIFAKEILSGNAETMGFLLTASAFGSLTAGLYLVQRQRVTGLGKIMARSTAFLGLALIVFSQSTRLEICLIIIFLIGLSMTLTLASISNFVQLVIVEEDKRGRLTSLFTMGFLGILPIGNLFFGGLANQIGVTNALVFGGTFCVIGSYFFARQLPTLRKIVYPIYEKMGLIPPSYEG
ncbi:MFS transporter [Nostocales cyanobacterium HT-58-2]|nr:MFS transporter [Nostocales cyanobacterium HT-58-2]